MSDQYRPPGMCSSIQGPTKSEDIPQTKEEIKEEIKRLNLLLMPDILEEFLDLHTRLNNFYFRGISFDEMPDCVKSKVALFLAQECMDNQQSIVREEK